MNNEPVAWMGIRRHGETRVSVEKLANDDIPLYTHPVKEHTTTLMESREKIFLNESHPVKEQVETIEYTCPNCQTHVGLHVKHPVKELTDEEILEVWDEDCVVLDEDKLVIRFAKAILRKAQEK